MTNREFYTAIASNETLSAELIDYATAALAKMDATNAKRKNTPSKKSVENAPILESITAELTSEAKTATDIAAAVGISTQKASALLRQLVAAGTAAATEVKVAGKGTQKAYTLAE